MTVCPAGSSIALSFALPTARFESSPAPDLQGSSLQAQGLPRTRRAWGATPMSQRLWLGCPWMLFGTVCALLPIGRVARSGSSMEGSMVLQIVICDTASLPPLAFLISWCAAPLLPRRPVVPLLSANLVSEGHGCLWGNASFKQSGPCVSHR